ncbi:glycosyl transferase family 1 [Halanaerobium congolense]|uniref:Glycosyl transferase family 1 n=1 Tax=Halanaerobium congolense TaxID=54121 RepID=A0A318E461_9FIRM|nr:glycosyltransferase [Halanaerobium congolense]PXV62290.1 glycosyl transferase family 1 [Halanaerobium congolense]
MEILYYFENKETYMDMWQQVHIFDELGKHNCNIKVFSPVGYNNMYEANEELLKYIRVNDIDLFMTPYGEEKLYIDTLKQIKKKSIPTLLICFDNLLIPYRHKSISKYFDLVWLTSKETKNKFEQWGANIIVQPYAANPYFFKPNYKDKINKVAFVGTPYGSRVNMVNKLVNNRINTTLFTKIDSKPEKNLLRKISSKLIYNLESIYNLLKFDIGRRIILGALKQNLLSSRKLELNSDYLEIKSQVEFSNLSKIYSNFALSLSSTSARNTGILKNPVNVINLRTFEIPMCGGLQFCRYFEEISDYFEEDKEIVFYRNKEELVEKAKFYLDESNSNQRKKIKLAARKRALNEHTWYHRFKEIFDFFGINKC